MSDTAADIVLRIRVQVMQLQDLRSLKTSMDAVAASMRNAENANKRIGRSMIPLKGAYSNLVNSLSRTERALDAVFRAGVHMQAMGRDLLGFGKKVGRMLSGMADAWGEFEFTLNRAAAAADIFDTSLPIYEKLQQAVFDVARELRVFPAEEVAKGLYFWQSTTGEVIETQEDLAKTMANVSVVMKAAAMTDTDYETAIKGVYSTIKQFNLSLDDTKDVTTLLFYATQKTALEFPDLIHSLKMTGAVAGNAGEPLKTMVAILGAVGNAGIRGSQAGRALRQTYIKVVRPTQQAKKVLDDLFKSQGGYNKVAFDSKGNFIGMEKYVTKLAGAMKGLNYQQRANIIATITTANELPVMTQMINMAMRSTKAGAKSWIDFYLTQEKATESFDRSWNILANSWRGITGLLQQTVQPIFIKVGKVIAKTLTPFVAELADELWNVGPAIEEMAQVIADGLTPALEFVMNIIRIGIKWFKENAKIVKQVAPYLALAVIITTVAGAFLLMVGTLTYLIATMILIVAGIAPLVIAFTTFALAIGFLVARIIANVGGIRDALANFAAAVGRIFELLIGGSSGAESAFDTLVNTISKISEVGLQAAADALNAVSDWLNSLDKKDVETLKDAVAALVSLVALNSGLGIAGGLLSKIAGNFKNLATAAKSIKGLGLLFVPLLGAIPGVVAGLGAIAAAVGAIVGGGMAAGLAIIGIFAVIAAAIAAYVLNIGGFRDAVNAFFGQIMTVIGPAIEGIMTTIGGFIDTILSPITTNLPKIEAFFDKIATKLSESWGPVFEHIGTVISEVFGTIQETIARVSESVMEGVQPMIDAIMNLANSISEFLGPAWNALVTIIGVAAGAIIAVVIELVNFFAPIVKGLVDLVVRVLGGAFNLLLEIAGAAISGIMNVIRNFADILSAIFDTLSAALKGDWGAMWNGILNIVKSFVALVESAIRGGIGILEGIIRGGLGIIDGIFKALFGSGPGSIYMSIVGFITTITDFGGNIIKGLVKGVEDAITWAIKTVKGLFGDIIDGIKGFLGIKSPATIMLSIGKNIVEGLWNGINNAKNWIIDKVVNFIRAIIPQPILDALGIHSPSRLMMGIGENVVKGLAVGIERTTDAYDAMLDQAHMIASAAQMAVAASSPFDSLSASGNFNSTSSSDNKRTVNLNVDVTSGDGSVNDLDINTLASLITGSDMVRALEMMGAVD